VSQWPRPLVLERASFVSTPQAGRGKKIGCGTLLPHDYRLHMSNSPFVHIIVIASKAKQSIAQHKERMDCFASLAMTGSYKFAISPRVSREAWPARSALSYQRAQGMPGARCARLPRVQWVAIERTRDSQVTPEIARHSPRNGFNGFLRALPGDRACLPPSPAASSRELDASVGASGPHDFAVRLKRPSSESASASTASRPAFVTLRNAPLWNRTARVVNLICPTPKAKYFCKRAWTRHDWKAN